ncbi:fatty acid-binding protein, intestinal isoform X5 [Microcaecilia unicolor]|uniref:Fatty acid-binding protein, intestinal-like isoform X5 n=1 Tax=Microcaecilia unicolor TaxID=1415580 RepID=A0A6P7WZK6_9AMPH|nr:fatty acid-binding protein, intestinal-like isoform X5 [Microcaecilia unicolor]
MAFDGTWKLDRTENYDKFMEVMGVDGKLAAQDNLMTIKQNGKQFSVHESSVFNASDMVFRLEEIHEYSMLGIKLVGIWRRLGLKLEGNFNRKDNKKLLKTEQEIAGGELIQVSLHC